MCVVCVVCCSEFAVARTRRKLYKIAQPHGTRDVRGRLWPVPCSCTMPPPNVAAPCFVERHREAMLSQLAAHRSTHLRCNNSTHDNNSTPRTAAPQENATKQLAQVGGGLWHTHARFYFRLSAGKKEWQSAQKFTR